MRASDHARDSTKIPNAVGTRVDACGDSTISLVSTFTAWMLLAASMRVFSRHADGFQGLRRAVTRGHHCSARRWPPPPRRDGPPCRRRAMRGLP